MEIRDLRQDWDAFGKCDPLWAIITDPAKRGNKWDLAKFFETGVREIDELVQYVATLGVPVSRRRALDFGCGVGRLSQALTRHFDEVHGVDVAPSMIELARQHNRCPETCTYHLNVSSSLAFFENDSFDLIYSNLVLQHIEPRYSVSYLREFIRVLAPGGVAVFQLPSEPKRAIDLAKYRAKQTAKRAALAFWRRTRYFSRPLMLMYGIRRDEVEKLLALGGARILDVKRDDSAGGGWLSYRYCVLKS